MGGPLKSQWSGVRPGRAGVGACPESRGRPGAEGGPVPGRGGVGRGPEASGRGVGSRVSPAPGGAGGGAEVGRAGRGCPGRGGVMGRANRAGRVQGRANEAAPRSPTPAPAPLYSPGRQRRRRLLSLRWLPRALLQPRVGSEAPCRSRPRAQRRPSTTLHFLRRGTPRSLWPIPGAPSPPLHPATSPAELAGAPNFASSLVVPRWARTCSPQVRP